MNRINVILRFSLFILIFTGCSILVRGLPVNEEDDNSASSELSVRNREETPTTAELRMRAFAEAYPQQIERVEYRGGDWAILLGETWFYHADGKVLAEHQLEDEAEFTRMSFYNYPAELPAWTAPAPEQVAIYRQWDEMRASRPPARRSPLFHDTLWSIHSREDAEQNMRDVNFLGRRIRVHYRIAGNLALVEEQIREAARTNRQVRDWVTNVGNANTYHVTAYSWRNIAETASRSLHSYGIAIDIYPRRLGNLQTYWLWSSQAGLDWWNVPYTRRYHPPDAVIKAFERFGFAWGGKWTQFDTMHFEYRPEILILNGMPPEMRR